MRIMGVDFGIREQLVSTCILNETSNGGIDLQLEQVAKVEKHEDIVPHIVKLVKELHIDYVVLEDVGVGSVICEMLTKQIGEYKLIRHKTNELNVSNVISKMRECYLVQELGYDIQVELRNGYIKFKRGYYSDTQLMKIKTLGLAIYYMNEKLSIRNTDYKKIFDMSSLYIKDGVIIKNRLGESTGKMSITEMFRIFKNYVVTIELDDKIETYYKGEKVGTLKKW